MRQRGLDALLIENPVDVFYLTGLSASLAQVVFLENRALLLVDGRYYEIAKNSDRLPILITQPRKIAARTLAHRVA